MRDTNYGIEILVTDEYAEDLRIISEGLRKLINEVFINDGIFDKKKNFEVQV